MIKKMLSFENNGWQKKNQMTNYVINQPELKYSEKQFQNVQFFSHPGY